MKKENHLSIEVVEITEFEDGGARITLDLSENAKNALISEGIKSALSKTIISHSGFELEDDGLF